MDNSLIKRQAAIDAINNIMPTKEGFLEPSAVFCELFQLQPAQPEQRWIPVTEKLPDMHDAGILKKLGIKQISDRVYITIEAKRNDGGVERITDTDAELRDGEWYSDALSWLKAAEKKIEVTAWMPYPAPYRKEGEV